MDVRGGVRRERFGSFLDEANSFALASTRVEETSSNERQSIGLVEKADELPAAVAAAAAAPPGLFLLHVRIDPELKADMATFKDNSSTAMNSG